jgi:uracil phosphoribosyltransferase
MKEFFLSQLRNRTANTQKFRAATSGISKLMASEISDQIGCKEIILIPILRAGLALLPAFQKIFEGAPIGFLGIKRDEKTALPHLYYQNLPPLSPQSHILLLDPMLATGGSANLALDIIKKEGGVHITLVSVIAAPEGIEAVKKRHPEVLSYSVAIDEKLDPQKYIVPGLGDFGDRYFGTTG